MKALTINGIGKYYNFFLFFGLSLLFFGCSNILSLQGYLIVLGASMLYVSCLLKGAFKPSKYFWLLVCFCVSYAIFSFLSGDRTVRSLISAFSYSIFVPIGISLPIFQDPTNVKLRKGIIWSMAAGLAVSAFFTVLATYLYAGRDLGDILITFWDEESTVRTGIQLYFIPLFSISLAYFFGWKRSLHSATYWVGFIGFAIFDIFVLYFSLEIGNRAIFVSFVALFLYVLIRIINTAKSRTFKITFFVFLSIVLIVALGLFLGILPVPDFLANIPVIERFLNGGSNNRRLSLYIDFIQNFFFRFRPAVIDAQFLRMPFYPPDGRIELKPRNKISVRITFQQRFHTLIDLCVIICSYTVPPRFYIETPYLRADTVDYLMIPVKKRISFRIVFTACTVIKRPRRVFHQAKRLFFS